MFTDTDVSGGIDYYYVVEATDGLACRSSQTNEELAQPRGNCLLEPIFGGLTSVGIDVDATCGLTIDWAAGQPAVGGLEGLR